MGLIKKIDVNDYFAAKRAVRLGRSGIMNQPATASNVPAVKPTRAKRVKGNRAQTNSLPNDPAISIPIIAGSDARRDRTLRGSKQN